MKKFFLIFAMIFCMGLSAKADVVPRYTTQIPNAGIGAFNVPQECTIYKEASEDSEKIAEVKWSREGVTADGKQIQEGDIFAAFVPVYGIAYATVEDEIDGWVKIFYSQSEGKSGWVKVTPKNKFISWMGFYMAYGRKYGVYFFKDMPDTNKMVMSSPSEDSQKISGYSYPKFVKLTLVRGNWMLVTILDIGNETHVGWMKWRTPEGGLLIFPKLYSD